MYHSFTSQEFTDTSRTQVPRAVLLSSLPSSKIAVIPKIAQIDLKSKTPPSSDSVSQEVRGLIRVAQRVVFSMLCLRCLTRCKQMERLTILFKDLAQIQDHADYVDATIDIHHGKRIHSSRGFGLWVLHQSMDHMVRYLVLGLELELYADWELSYVYW